MARNFALQKFDRRLRPPRSRQASRIDESAPPAFGRIALAAKQPGAMAIPGSWGFDGGLMKLARYGRAGKEKPALVDREGKLRDLSEVVSDIDADVLGPALWPVWPSSSRNPCPRCAARPGSAHASRKSAISLPSGSITPTTRPSPACRSRRSRCCSTRPRPASWGRTTTS